ncbi:LamB/YcsF family protein [Corynebacterium caspium]|uniref:LamB/YcsF family protein n=1 Tax=Corynebacterium caspium TaxID=234828 RepID=UPI0003657368|nr:5-oxoprolinase subunit PxpA [Corynebacterium caspium]WKD59591.1 LamB/YcsF family protein [Corynebacterium caspium DSM 44850]
MKTIDLNADLGEKIGADQQMLQLISSANIACGFHAGDASHISTAIGYAVSAGVTVGAHPSYNDPTGFGRRYMDYSPAELKADFIYQIGAIAALAKSHGTVVSYVKPHGAVYNQIVHDKKHARAVVEAVAACGELPIMLLPGAVAIDIALEKGLPVIREAFADRAYNPDGTLVSRRLPGAVLTDPTAVAERILGLVTTGTLSAYDGSTLEIAADSICVHGDSPSALAMTQAIVDKLHTAGIKIQSLL